MTEATAFLSNVVFNLLYIDTQLRYSSWAVFINLLLLPPTFSNILLKIAQHFSALLLMPGI
jgi:hypothetical protein